MNNIQKLNDIPLNNYSLDSLNAFLKIESSCDNRADDNNIGESRFYDYNVDSKKDDDHIDDIGGKVGEIGAIDDNIFTSTLSFAAKKEKKMGGTSGGGSNNGHMNNNNLKSSSLYESETNHMSNNINNNSSTSKNTSVVKKVNHHPQILDEDTERFKLRLDEMINKFKLETITEFMSTKKSLLDEQQSHITNEKMINESRFQSKCFEVSLFYSS